jgi:hypothetical protein
VAARTVGSFVSVMNTITNLLPSIGAGTTANSVVQYLFTTTDFTGNILLDPISGLPVTQVYNQSYNTAQIAALGGGSVYNQVTYTSIGLDGGIFGASYWFVAEAEIQNSISSVPEPGTFILAGSGLLGLFLMRRRARKA